jgi:Cys-tRNA(Pro)/Cys-tRNA(Cys) deacylase
MHTKVHTILTNQAIGYTEIKHASFNTPINSPVDFAAAMGYDLERITKSVFLRSKTRDKFIMAVCSASKKLNFPKLAELAGVNKFEVADKQDLADLIGYPVYSVSPIGLSPEIAIYMDDSLMHLPTILVGSGEIAVEIEIKPADLQEIVKATLNSITL